MNKEPKNAGFDLKALSVNSEEQTATMEAMNPKTGEPLMDEKGNKVTITVHGPDSDVFRQASRKTTNRRLQGAKGGRLRVTAEQLEAEALEILIAVTKDWENIAFDGQALAPNPKNVRMVYSNVPWLREQVDEFLNDRANFLGK